jgi:hypothetical protein
MKAIAFTRPLPIEAEGSLIELELSQPEFGPRDLLVDVRAVSVNPVDTRCGARGTKDLDRITQANRGCLAGMLRVWWWAKRRGHRIRCGR